MVVVALCALGKESATVNAVALLAILAFSWAAAKSSNALLNRIGSPILMACFGGIGMLVGCSLDGSGTCCQEPFSLRQILSFESGLMLLWCVIGHVLWSGGWGCLQTGLAPIASAVLLMYAGMILGGILLDPPMAALIGPSQSCFWAMFAGMAAAHGCTPDAFIFRRSRIPQFLRVTPMQRRLPKFSD
jgi:hypothetical protein